MNKLAFDLVAVIAIQHAPDENISIVLIYFETAKSWAIPRLLRTITKIPFIRAITKICSRISHKPFISAGIFNDILGFRRSSGTDYLHTFFLASRDNATEQWWRIFGYAIELCTWVDAACARRSGSAVAAKTTCRAQEWRPIISWTPAIQNVRSQAPPTCSGAYLAECWRLGSIPCGLAA